MGMTWIQNNDDVMAYRNVPGKDHRRRASSMMQEAIGVVDDTYSPSAQRCVCTDIGIVAASPRTKWKKKKKKRERERERETVNGDGQPTSSMTLQEQRLEV